MLTDLEGVAVWFLLHWALDDLGSARRAPGEGGRGWEKQTPETLRKTSPDA